MGAPAVGVITSFHYSAAHDSPENKAYVDAFMKANNGMRPNFHSVGGYDGMHLIYEAVKKAGANADGEQLVEAMKGMKWTSPRGPMSIDPATRDVDADRLPARGEDGQRQAVERRVRQVRERQGPRLMGPTPVAVPTECRPASPLTSTDGNMIGNLIGVLFDGIAYGSLLFVISIGLSVTMGLMNFVNLAHGAFAMLGGYACVVLMTRARRAVPGDAAGRLPRRRRSPASCSSARSTSGCTRRRTSTR